MSDLNISPGGVSGSAQPTPPGSVAWAVADVDPFDGTPISVDPGDPVTPDPGDSGVIYLARNDNTHDAAANVLGFARSAGESPGRAMVFYGPGPLTLPTTRWDALTGGSGGLTPGSVYYLGATKGSITATPPGAGISTALGFAISATTLMVQIGNATPLA